MGTCKITEKAGTSRREHQTVKQQPAAGSSIPLSSNQPPGTADREAATSHREQRTEEGSDRPQGTADRGAAASRREQRTGEDSDQPPGTVDRGAAANHREQRTCQKAANEARQRPSTRQTGKDSGRRTPTRREQIFVVSIAK